mgnify:CR=1 FL=1
MPLAGRCGDARRLESDLGVAGLHRVERKREELLTLQPKSLMPGHLLAVRTAGEGLLLPALLQALDFDTFE